MDPLTLELFRCLQSEPHDESGLQRIRSLLRTQRRVLHTQGDLATLRDIVQMLEDWAQASSVTKAAIDALSDAAEIAERDLKQPVQANRLRSIATERSSAPERAASGTTTYAALGRRRCDDGDLDGAIEAYERALEEEAELASVRQLADLFAKRKGPGDAEQAADLYFTLGEVLGNPDGVDLLKRALDQRPDHPAALALLESYSVSGRDKRDQGQRSKAPVPREQPKLEPTTGPSLTRTLAGAPAPMRAAAIAAIKVPPAINKAPPPLRAAGTSSAPSLNAPVSSLTPVVRDDARAEPPAFEPPPRSARRAWVAAGSLLATAAAAAGVVIFSHGGIAGGKALLTGAPAAVDVSATGQVRAPAIPIVAPPAPAPIPAPAESAKVVAVAETLAAPALAEAPAPEAKPTPEAPAKSARAKPAVELLMDLATVRGGKLTPAQLSAALDKTTPKIERCYVQALKKKPHDKGRLTFAWTVRPNGRVTSLKKTADTINDAPLAACTEQAIAATKFAKPRKAAAQIKLPLDFSR